MKLLYTICWLMICLGVILMVGTLAYDILILEVLSIENSRTIGEVERDTRLFLSGAAIEMVWEESEITA